MMAYVFIWSCWPWSCRAVVKLDAVSPMWEPNIRSNQLSRTLRHFLPMKRVAAPFLKSDQARGLSLLRVGNNLVRQSSTDKLLALKHGFHSN